MYAKHKQRVKAKDPKYDFFDLQHEENGNQFTEEKIHRTVQAHLTVQRSSSSSYYPDSRATNSTSNHSAPRSCSNLQECWTSGSRGRTPRRPLDSRLRTPHTGNSTTPLTTRKTVIAAVAEGRGTAKGEIGLASLDLKNPELVLTQFSDNQVYTKLLTKLLILNPVEVILPSTAFENNASCQLFQMIETNLSEINLTTVQRRYFNESQGLQYIQQLCVPEYASVTMELNNKYYCLSAASALLKYMEFIQNVMYTPKSLKIVFTVGESTTMIDMATVRNLELVVNSLDVKSKHSLFGILNQTRTPGGARLLRANILQPPCHLDTITVRLNCLQELLENEDLFYNLQAVLGRFLDTEHLLSLLILIPKQETVKTADQKISNIIYLKHTLELVSALRTVLEGSQNPFFRTYHQALGDSRFEHMLEQINEVIHDDVRYQKGALQMKTQRCFAVKPNINGLLDVARRTYTETIDDITEMVKQLSSGYNLPLRLTYSVTRGFHVQMTLPEHKGADSLNLPSTFLKISKSKNLVNFITADLVRDDALNHFNRVRESMNEISLMSNVIVSKLLQEICEQIGCLYKLAECVDNLDVMVSLAHVCSVSDYVRPDFSDTLGVKGGRHPILERVFPDTLVPNSTFLNEENNFMIITGPNMSGKSTYLKQVALLQVMAQMGSFVPAEFATFRLTSHIFSRIGSNDDMQSNSSTFMIELKEVNYILQNAADNSLIIMDELGRGTSVEEGAGICYGICERLQTLKAFSLVATHFLDVCQLEINYPNVSNYHMEVCSVEREDVIRPSYQYTHILVKGRTHEEHYGLKLAEFLGLPGKILDDAKHFVTRIEQNREASCSRTPRQSQQKMKFLLASELLQIARNSQLDEDSLRELLQAHKASYQRDISSIEEE